MVIRTKILTLMLFAGTLVQSAHGAAVAASHPVPRDMWNYPHDAQAYFKKKAAYARLTFTEALRAYSRIPGDKTDLFINMTKDAPWHEELCADIVRKTPTIDSENIAKFAFFIRCYPKLAALNPELFITLMLNNPIIALNLLKEFQIARYIPEELFASLQHPEALKKSYKPYSSHQTIAEVIVHSLGKSLAVIKKHYPKLIYNSDLYITFLDPDTIHPFYHDEIRRDFHEKLFASLQVPEIRRRLGPPMVQFLANKLIKRYPNDPRSEAIALTLLGEAPPFMTQATRDAQLRALNTLIPRNIPAWVIVAVQNSGAIPIILFHRIYQAASSFEQGTLNKVAVEQWGHNWKTKGERAEVAVIPAIVPPVPAAIPAGPRAIPAPPVPRFTVDSVAVTEEGVVPTTAITPVATNIPAAIGEKLYQILLRETAIINSSNVDVFKWLMDTQPELARLNPGLFVRSILRDPRIIFDLVTADMLKCNPELFFALIQNPEAPGILGENILTFITSLLRTFHPHNPHFKATAAAPGAPAAAAV